VQANGLRIAYDLVGEEGSSVLFLHGVGSDRRVWREQLRDLGQDHRAVALDFRGHGESEPPVEPIDRAAFAADISGLLQALDLGPAHFVGLSMGGVMALETYRLYPDCVLSLTLADTFAHYPGWEDGMRARKRDLERMSMRELAEARMASTLKPDADPDTLREATEQMAIKDERVYLQSSDATWSPDHRPLLPLVRVPTLVLWGELDDLTPRALSEELQRGIPGAVLRALPDAGHISNLDNPAAFNSAVREFVEEVDASETEGVAI
jgi:3-oxoadipate enol-lactonase